MYYFKLNTFNRHTHIFFLFIFHYIKMLMIQDIENRKTIYNMFYELTVMNAVY